MYAMTKEEKQKRFTLFVKEHQGIIRKLCRGYSNNVEDFEDNVQEVHYQLWKSIDRFEERSSAGTWVYRLTLNVCLYNLSKRKKRVDYPMEGKVVTELADAKHEFFQEDGPVRILYDSIALLKPIERTIIMLYLEKKEHAVIAEVVGLSVSNVGVKVNRIKKKLKEIVDERLAGNVE
ncbi:DNA-directed RNA polymerase sigma-70 factor [Marivirga lumbricoides]|uniref:DNA-directed RNA polymerase sigma-70 factor n=2 Tax=Marivirga lumbricoides TaxID=1046115 RepID=A0ABQ1LI11_9BACT|nr:DNA-directed RNA polymerase sigma-70 factor [Marivirga lumbricoides]